MVVTERSVHVIHQMESDVKLFGVELFETTRVTTFIRIFKKKYCSVVMICVIAGACSRNERVNHVTS